MRNAHALNGQRSLGCQNETGGPLAWGVCVGAVGNVCPAQAGQGGGAEGARPQPSKLGGGVPRSVARAQ